MKNIIRIATRNSPLALRQATMVKDLLASDINCELVPMTSSGDTFSSKRFKQHGGKGLFLKELHHNHALIHLTFICCLQNTSCYQKI